jgi:NADH:ubiquinone oxidoreductase subunit E
MGSSCFARGNGANLEVIENWLDKNRLQADVELTGTRCEGCCAEGPNLLVNGRRFHKVDRETLLDILREFCPAKEGGK